MDKIHYNILGYDVSPEQLDVAMRLLSFAGYVILAVVVGVGVRRFYKKVMKD